MDFTQPISQEESDALFKRTSVNEDFDWDDGNLYDPEQVGPNYDPEQLATMIHTSYRHAEGLWDEEYQLLINAAIQNNNIHALSLLWNGVYYHDRDNPNYNADLLHAAKNGNYKTFQYVLNGFLNYATLDGKEPVPIAELLEGVQDDKTRAFLENYDGIEIKPINF